MTNYRRTQPSCQICRDGFAATKEIRRLEAAGTLSTRHFIIAVTGNARSEQVQSAWDSGVDKVIIKVFRWTFGVA